MKKKSIIFLVFVLASLASFARSPKNLYSIGNVANWNDPASWSNTYGGLSCMTIPESNDSIFITSDISLNIDFTLSNGGYIFIHSGCSLMSNNFKIIITEDGTIICNGNLKVHQIEAGNRSHIQIGKLGKVKVLDDFVNNSNMVVIDGLLDVDGTLQNNNLEGLPVISGKGTITSGAYTGTGSILGITNISLIPPQSVISECTWTGSYSSDWNDRLNWSYERLPEPEQHISILASRNFAPSVNSITICNNLMINSGASLVISPDGALTISGDLTVAEGGEMRLRDGESSHGSLITMGNSIGNIVFEYNVIKNRQCDVSSPISNAQSSVFLNMYLRDYNEANAGWGQYIIPTNVNLGVMEGYEVFSTYSDTREFNGQPNSGEKQINIGTSGDGWNFIGNPYPSALNWGSQMEPSTGWSRNDIYGAIYYWDNTANGNKGNYAVYCPGGNGIGANGGSRIILPSQGFFVKAKNPGSIHVTDDARIHPGNMEKQGNNNSETSTLRLIARGNSMSDESVLQFNNDATSGFDSDFDALKLQGNELAPSLYTTLDDETQLSINSLPSSSLESDIPLGFSCGKAGTYTIDVNGLNSINPDLPIYLKDTRNNTLTNLRKDSSYVFDYRINDKPMRFLLHFSSPTGITGTEFDHPSVYASPGYINVQLGSIHSNSFIKVFDLAGKQVAEFSPAIQGLNRIPFSGSAGLYVIKITNHTNSYTTKLWIY